MVRKLLNSRTALNNQQVIEIGWAIGHYSAGSYKIEVYEQLRWTASELAKKKIENERGGRWGLETYEYIVVQFHTHFPSSEAAEKFIGSRDGKTILNVLAKRAFKENQAKEIKS